MGTATIDIERTAVHHDLGADLPELPELEEHFGHGAFVRWLLVCTLLAVLSVGALNWYVDPTGVTGRVTPWRIGENAEVRTGKLDLYEALLARGQEPEVVLFGSSRAMKFDPAHVRQLTGATAFNASVSGGVPRDAWLFAQVLEERQRERFPHLVWALDVDAFRDKQLRDGLSTDPRMARFIPRAERIATSVATAGTLTELQTLKATARSLRAGGSVGVARPRGMERRFSEHGFQRWSLTFSTRGSTQEQLIRRQIAQYAGFIFERDAYTEVEDEPLEEFLDVVRIANAHGDVPTIFLTPYHPLAERLLARYELEEREDEVRATLRALQRDRNVEFEFVDLSNLSSFEGDAAQFYDGVHMTPANTRRVLEHLDGRGLLAPRRGAD